jgi:GntR family transcriptional regulator
LRITGKKLVVEIKRVFMNQKKAEIFEIKYIPYFRGVPIVEQAIGNDIFSEKLVTKCSKFVATKKIEIKIAPISGEVCDILNMDEGSMLLLVEQKQFDEKNNPVEWCRQYFSGNSDRLCAIASCY